MLLRRIKKYWLVAWLAARCRQRPGLDAASAGVSLASIACALPSVLQTDRIISMPLVKASSVVHPRPGRRARDRFRQLLRSLPERQTRRLRVTLDIALRRLMPLSQLRPAAGSTVYLKARPTEYRKRAFFPPRAANIRSR